MSDPRKQWAIVQQRPRPLSPAETRRIHAACLELGITGYVGDVVYAAFVAALPRPIKVEHHGPRRLDMKGWRCRLCPARAHSMRWTHTTAIASGLRHLYDAHGCPNRRTTGEPCDTACIHCHGWQWCAQPNEKSDW